MDQRIQQFRRIGKRVRQGRRSGAAPYPKEAKAIALEIARERGVRAQDSIKFANELGLAPQTLAAWLSQEQHDEGLLSVRLVGAEPGSEGEPTCPKRPSSTLEPEASPVVVLPSGVRLEGLDLEAMVVVARALS